jgi:hypothetical protein
LVPGLRPHLGSRLNLLGQPKAAIDPRDEVEKDGISNRW